MTAEPGFTSDSSVQVTVSTTAKSLGELLRSAGEDPGLVNRINQFTIQCEDNDIRIARNNDPTTGKGIILYQEQSILTISAPPDEIKVIATTGTAKINIFPGTIQIGAALPNIS